VAVSPTVRADSIIFDDNFNNASNNLANNDQGVGGGFSSYSRDNGIDAYESGGYGVISTSVAGFNQASINTINPLNLSAGGTTFELSGVKFSPNTSNTGQGTADQLFWGVGLTNSAGNWYANGSGGLPAGFYVQIMSDSIPNGSGTSGFTGTSVLFYKDTSTNLTVLASWAFDNLRWSQNGPTNYAPVLDMKLTLTSTGWALNITGDTATNNPISYSGTFAAAGIVNQLTDGLTQSYLGAFTASDPPGITMAIKEAKVYQVGNLDVTTPAFRTPEYGMNVNTVLAGEAVSLISSVTDSSGTPTLHWQLEDLSNPGTFTNLPSGSLTNVNVNTTGLGDFQPRGIRLIATDGLNSVTSSVVYLTVDPPSAPQLATDVNPTSQTLFVGAAGEISATFTGNLPLSYRWQFSANNVTFTNIPPSINSTATNNTLIIANANVGNSGYYHLVATNIIGAATSSVAFVDVQSGSPQYLWSAPVSFSGLNSDQILTNFPPANKIAGAMYATNGGAPLVVTTGTGGNITFGASTLSSITVTGGNGFGAGANTNQTGNANFNTCLNDFQYDNTTHYITLNNLIVGQQYQLQLFGLDDRAGNQARLANYQDPNNAGDVSINYHMGDNVYMLATFTASNTVQVIQQNLVDANADGLGNFNCAVLRTVGWNPPPYFPYEPQSQASFLGHSISFLGIAAGDPTIPSPTITYQWKSGPVGGPYTNLVEGAKWSGTTTTNLTINNLTADDGTPVYVLVASNGGGTQISTEASLEVQHAPSTISPGSFAAAALTNNPVALWLLDEIDNPASGVLRAYDYTGHGFNGIYGTASLDGYGANQGPQPPTYPGFYTGETALGVVANNASSTVSIPPLNLNPTNVAVTIAMWINPIDNGGYARGLFFARNTGNGTGNGGNQIGGLGYAANSGNLGYNWNDNGGTYGYNSGLSPKVGTWNFVVLVIQTNQATFYLYYLDPTSGSPVLLSAVNPVANAAALNMNGGLINIGTDQYASASRAFNGSIAGTAIFNSALSASQVQQMFGAGVGIAGGFAPSISSQPPTNIVTYTGFKVQLRALAGGTAPITNQWKFNNVGLVDGTYNGVTITGSTSNVLTIANLSPSYAGVYKSVFSNPIGSTTTSNINLTILTPTPPPSANVVGEWLAGGQTYQDVSGYTPAGTHDAGLVGGTGAHYWTNDVPPAAPPGSMSLHLSGDGLVVSNSSTLDAAYEPVFDVGISNAMSVTFWAKGWPGSWNAFVSKYGEGPGWQLRNDGNNNVSPCWTVRGNSGTVTLGTAVYGNADDMAATSLTYGNDGKWHFYAGTYDVSTGIRSLYVDGNLVAQQTGNGQYNTAPAEHLVIGGKDSPPGNSIGGYYTGLFYDVRVYNVALTGVQQAYPVLSHNPTLTTGVLPGSGGNPGQLVLSWSQGTLLEATNLSGPWVTNAIQTSPLTNTMNKPADFYKVGP
jgi:hypothetical protein